jgi:hypothetical protein
MSANAVRSFEHRYMVAEAGQLIGATEAGDPTSGDHHGLAGESGFAALGRPMQQDG